MARGWESKFVEEQIQERESASGKRGNPKYSAEQLKENTRREGLLQAILRTTHALESARDERYRALMQRTLTDLQSELEKLGKR